MLIHRVEAEKLNKAIEMLKAGAHPQRMAIIDVLSSGKKYTNTQLQEILNIEQAILSQHLTLMRNKGILDVKKEGKYRYYYIRQKEFIKILNCIENCCHKL
jgi:DNA-binding transcriptional ArsR family regulator